MNVLSFDAFEELMISQNEIDEGLVIFSPESYEYLSEQLAICEELMAINEDVANANAPRDSTFITKATWFGLTMEPGITLAVFGGLAATGFIMTSIITSAKHRKRVKEINELIFGKGTKSSAKSMNGWQKLVVNSIDDEKVKNIEYDEKGNPKNGINIQELSLQDLIVLRGRLIRDNKSVYNIEDIQKLMTISYFDYNSISMSKKNAEVETSSLGKKLSGNGNNVDAYHSQPNADSYNSRDINMNLTGGYYDRNGKDYALAQLTREIQYVADSRKKLQNDLKTLSPEKFKEKYHRTPEDAEVAILAQYEYSLNSLIETKQILDRKNKDADAFKQLIAYNKNINMIVDKIHDIIDSAKITVGEKHGVGKKVLINYCANIVNMILMVVNDGMTHATGTVKQIDQSKETKIKIEDETIEVPEIEDEPKPDNNDKNDLEFLKKKLKFYQRKKSDMETEMKNLDKESELYKSLEIGIKSMEYDIEYLEYLIKSNEDFDEKIVDTNKKFNKGIKHDIEMATDAQKEFNHDALMNDISGINEVIQNKIENGSKTLTGIFGEDNVFDTANENYKIISTHDITKNGHILFTLAEVNDEVKKDQFKDKKWYTAMGNQYMPGFKLNGVEMSDGKPDLSDNGFIKVKNENSMVNFVNANDETLLDKWAWSIRGDLSDNVIAVQRNKTRNGNWNYLDTDDEDVPKKDKDFIYRQGEVNLNNAYAEASKSEDGKKVKNFARFQQTMEDGSVNTFYLNAETPDNITISQKTDKDGKTVKQKKPKDGQTDDPKKLKVVIDKKGEPLDITDSK